MYYNGAAHLFVTVTKKDALCPMGPSKLKLRKEAIVGQPIRSSLNEASFDNCLFEQNWGVRTEKEGCSAQNSAEPHVPKMD